MEETCIIDIAVQNFRDILAVEDTFLPRDQVKYNLRPALDPTGVLSTPLFLQLQPLERSLLLCTLRLPLDRLRTDAEMNGRCQLDALLLERSSIDPGVEAGKRQMPVLASEPAVPKTVEVIEAAGPKLIDDLAAIVAQHIAVRAGDRHLLRPEPILDQRPQRRHQMDMRIARCVVENPVGNHAPSCDVPRHEIPDQFDALLGREFERERYGDVLGELRIRSLLELLDSVPERFRCPRHRPICNYRAKPFRCIGGNDKLLM